ncbi:hypothetical protein ACA910_010168 [Epithemia clementina (nom. ined.)]
MEGSADSERSNRSGPLDAAEAEAEPDQNDQHTQTQQQEDHVDVSVSTGNNTNASSESMNFRKRRLSLPKHRLQAAAIAASVVAAEVNGDDDHDHDMDHQHNHKRMKHGSADEKVLTPQKDGLKLHLSVEQQDPENGSEECDAGDKASTFRKRRLSLTFKQMPSSCFLDDDDDNDNKDDNSPKNGGNLPAPRPMKQRRLSTAENSAASSNTALSGSSSLNNSNNSSKNLTSKPRILHSAEMISGPFAPPSPIHHNHVLHQQNPLPPTQSSLLDLEDSTLMAAAAAVEQPYLESNSLEFSPRRQRTSRSSSIHRRRRRNSWRQRHYHFDDDMLPFPKHKVGTYSCHGIEPIYDEGDFYAHQQRDEQQQLQEEEEEEEQQQPPPTMTVQAKIGRDNNSFWDEEDDDEDDDVENHDSSRPNPLASTTPNPAELSEQQQQQMHVQQPQQEGLYATPAAISAKINQDRGGITYPYANSDRTALFAVYDGHGQGGELVSQFALHEIQRRLEKHPSFHSSLEQAMRETFLTVDEALKHEPIIEPFFAGTTACVALLQDNRLTLANAGDSRAVLGRKRPDNGDWQGINLTQDQNPDSPLEMERILKLGGYISPPPGPGLSARVWLDSDMTQIGLAMARSIGDHAVSDVGVIADPVVSTHTVTAGDEFMILASDGVWEFLNTQEAVQIVGDHLEELGATKACQALIEAAASKWHEEEGEYRDDITAIVVHFPPLWGTTTTTTTTGGSSNDRGEGSQQQGQPQQPKY